MSERIIITIARQFGSGGRNIGKKLAKALEIPFYDQELIDEGAKESGINPEMVKDLEETPTNSLLYSIATSSFFGAGHFSPTVELPMTDRLFLAQSDVIRKFAAEGSCVIVGRCADFVLREQDVRLLREFISAPEEHRVARKMEQERLSHNQAVQLVRKMDKQRKKYYESYTGQVWGAPQFHDLCLDTSRFSIPECVELIVTKFLTL